MTDIVEWLRHAIEWHHGKDTNLLKNSADEIERLRERVAVLEATLEGALDSCKIWERILTNALGEKE